MGQLKPSEVRLLIFFCLTVVGLASFLAYEQYAKKIAALKVQKAQFEGEREHLRTLKTQQTEYNEKLNWMNDNQPLARDEFAAKDALDNVVSLRGIEAAGLVLVSSPPEKGHRMEDFYWAFERRMVVQGSLQNIVQWMTNLQSETAFRAVTQLHIFPKKKKEAEILTCEITVEQRYATDEVIQKTTPGVALASMAPQESSTPAVQPTLTSAGMPAPVPMKPAVETPEAEKAASADQPPVSRRVVTPGASSDDAKPARPKVRLPKPVVPKDESTSSTGRADSASVLSDARRNSAGSKAPLPPVLQEDLDAAKQFAYDTETEVRAVRTGIVSAEVSETTNPVPVFRAEPGQLPSSPDAVPLNDAVPAVGEAWDADTPSLSQTPAGAQPQLPGPQLPETY